MEPREYETLRSLEERFWWYRGLHRRVLDALPARANRVLDAGCGTGGMLAQIAARGQAHGIDFSPHALRFARERGLTRLGRASVEALPFRSSSFDVAISLDVLYHRAVSDDSQALRELCRVLRPGGRVILNLPAFESLRSSHDTAIHTARRYERRALAKQLEQCGLTPVRLAYWNALLFPALAGVRLLRKREAGGHPESDVRPLPRPINAVLEGVLEIERALMKGIDFPAGLSILVVAERPGDA